ncbi:fasciclin domain-containing protein [uncultured Nocardioides sp.]|uniref:fasciclin domain-containing protein n=1 Tax=uncultured Nocardioides sp. TaxID=198441 RepID=UPI00260FA033|nr:fasciclin domain-containing protein [uncultured Nocardioides sp.]
MKKTLRSLTATAAAAALVSAGVATAAPASAETGNRSLAKVLAADSGFDSNAKDFDALEKAVLFVLDKNPESPVGLLTRGKQRATAFLPTDLAFSRLVTSLTGEKPANERQAWQTARSLGAETIEEILLYHVVPGKTLTSDKVLAARGTRVDVANGDSVRVVVRKGRVFLGDRDQEATNPEVTVLDINRGNKQVGHAVNRVLRPFSFSESRKG